MESQEEHNGANFSFATPSSEELHDCMSAESNFIKMPYYSPRFSAKNGMNRFRRNRISTERASQEEQNGTRNMPHANAQAW